MPERTVAQALVRFLAVQEVERDLVRGRFFEGCFGIFGHGNIAGLGEALGSNAESMPYYLARNEQAMVHTAVGFARERKRLAALACTTSTGPGATNLVTGAAAATINRLPVLLLPSDVFATRAPHPVLQQLEQPSTGDVSVNDCLRPVSKYFDRIQRPEQLIPAALEAMRVLTDPAETGAVTLCLPQDVQTEAFDFPEDFFLPRVWSIDRRPPDPIALERCVSLIKGARRPLVVAGGGVIYSDAAEALQTLTRLTGIPVAETQAGKGALSAGMPGALGGIGATGTPAANRVAEKADVVIGVGTRWTDFTTASKTVFGDPRVRFVNINVARLDASKLSGLVLEGDARIVLERLTQELEGYEAPLEHRSKVDELTEDWDRQVDRIYGSKHEPLPSQAEIIGALEVACRPEDVIVAAAGSSPGELHRLWRSKRPGDYHVEYGYSTMGYEIAGALGVKMASPQREVFVIVGDGSYLMLASEIATAVQERVKLVIVLVDNRGFASIGALSRSLGSSGFGTRYRVRGDDGLTLDGVREDPRRQLPTDLGANAASLGAKLLRAGTIEEFKASLDQARNLAGPVVISIEADRFVAPPSFGWWDVPVAAVSDSEDVRRSRTAYVAQLERQRSFLNTSRRVQDE